MITAFWVVDMSYTEPFSWDLLLPWNEQRGCNGQGGPVTIHRRSEKPGPSSQQDPRFAAVGTQLRVVLSADRWTSCEQHMWCRVGPEVQRLLSHWLELLCFWKDQFSQLMLRVPWKSVGGCLLFWCIDVWHYCRKDKDLRLEGFFTFTHLKWGSWMPSLDFLFAKQPQLTLSTGIIVSSHHFWKMGH